MLSCVNGFLPTDIANIYIFLQSMLNWNIISSYIKVNQGKFTADKQKATTF